MIGMNKVILIGYLGADPEFRTTTESVAVATFNVATAKRWKDKEGATHEETEWHRVTAWRGLAEVAYKFLKKGSAVCIEGHLKTRQYTDKEGVKRYATEVVADDLQMLDRTPQAPVAP